MQTRTRSALVWGIVGLFAFLVLRAGYLLVIGGLPLGMAGTLLGALLVGAVVAVLAYVVENRLTRKGRV